MADESNGNGSGDGDIDGEMLVRLLRATDLVHTGVMDAIRSSGLFSPPLSYRGRVKSEDGVRSKIRRKRSTNPNYALHDVRDLLGVRFITLLRNDIAPVTSNLLSILAKQAGGQSDGLGEVTLLEFKQYIASPPIAIDPETGEWLDPLRERLSPLLELHFGPDCPVEFVVEKRAQYSGVHVIASYRVKSGARTLDVPVEYQIRSVFEEAWGELDHKLFYESDREGLIKGEEHRLSLSKHLRILKAMLDSAADYAELLWSMDLNAGDERRPDVKVNLDDIAYLESLIDRLSHAPPLFQRFIGLAREKDKTDKSKGQRRNAYEALADQFSALADDLKTAIDIESFSKADLPVIKTVSYLVIMEEAICRLLTGSVHQIRIAISLYHDTLFGRPFEYVHTSFDRYPTAWFRLAQCHEALIELVEDLGEKEEHAASAAENYEHARAKLDDLPKDYSLSISPDQFNYLKNNVDRLQAFVHWRISNIRRKLEKPSEKDRVDVSTAWAIVGQKALSMEDAADPAEISLLNSAVYFALDGLLICERLDAPPTDLPSRDDLMRLIDRLESAVVDRAETGERIWHTIMRGRQFLGQYDQAKRAARRIMRIRKQMNILDLSPYYLDMHELIGKEAWDVIDKDNDD